MNIPYTKDMLQLEKKLEIPEIRVWCHPHYIEKTGDDYYQVFKTFEEALIFIKKHKEAEDVPLVAMSGLEINLFDIK